MRPLFKKVLHLLAASVLLLSASAHAAEPLRIGYSDWPGWVIWQVPIEKGWFKQAGLNVKFEWFDYSASMEAFTAGKLDMVGMTNGDTLVTGATGGKGVVFLLNDYSAGNDMIVARPGINSVKDLKGKKIGVELGLVDHLLLLNALKKNGLKESDDWRLATELRHCVADGAGFQGDLYQRRRTGSDL
jgi:NitT/TauT family transport system substrate-binding protein